MRRRVALTGIGLLTPFGVGIEPFWSGLIERRTAVRRAEGIELADYPCQFVGQMPPIDFDQWLDPQESAFWSRATKTSMLGALLAVRDAGLEKPPGDRTGVILGTGYGCVYEYEETYITWLQKGWKRVKPVTVPKGMPNAPASQIAIALGARGINFTVSTACSSGAIAAGLATERIRAGDLDACVTGGVDVIVNTSILGAWNALRVLSRRNDPTASRPFSKDRDGLVMAEGCAMFLLEEWESARRRGARIHAEITGVGSNNDAVNIVAPDLRGEIECIRRALGDAGLRPDDVDHVNAHGTSTPVNDANESRVLKEVFGERARRIPVTSIKGHIGHAMGAAGAIEIAATALAVEHQTAPPTLHFVPGDPDCDLDYVADGPRPIPMRHAITNSFGFGGQNSVIVLSRA